MGSILHHITPPATYYSTTLTQHRTHMALILDSTGLLERSKFAILKKISGVTNDT